MRATRRPTIPGWKRSSASDCAREWHSIRQRAIPIPPNCLIPSRKAGRCLVEGRFYILQLPDLRKQYSYLQFYTQGSPDSIASQLPLAIKPTSQYHVVVQSPSIHPLGIKIDLKSTIQEACK